MSNRERRKYSGAEKVKILRLHLLEHKPISEVCEDATRCVFLSTWSAPESTGDANCTANRSGEDERILMARPRMCATGWQVLHLGTWQRAPRSPA